MQEEQKEFSLVEICLGTLTLFSFDAGCIILDLTGVGAAIAPLLQAAGSFATSWWLHMKGGKKAFGLGRQIAKYGSNILPIVPTLTLAFWIEVYVHNHPESSVAQVAKTAGKATALTKS